MEYVGATGAIREWCRPSATTGRMVGPSQGCTSWRLGRAEGKRPSRNDGGAGALSCGRRNGDRLSCTRRLGIGRHEPGSSTPNDVNVGQPTLWAGSVRFPTKTGVRFTHLEAPPAPAADAIVRVRACARAGFWQTWSEALLAGTRKVRCAVRCGPGRRWTNGWRACRCQMSRQSAPVPNSILGEYRVLRKYACRVRNGASLGLRSLIDNRQPEPFSRPSRLTPSPSC